MEEKEKILAKHKKTKPDEEQQQDVVVITEDGCKTEFVVVESVHYALVRKLDLKFLPTLFSIPRKPRKNVSVRMLLIAEKNHTKTVRTW